MNELRMAAGEHPVFTSGQARLAGVGPHDLTRLVKAGSVTSLRHGWYALGTPDDQHKAYLLRVQAAEAGYAGRAVPSHYSALAQLGVPLYRADLDRVHLMLVGPGYPRSRRGLSLHPPTKLPLAAGERVTPALAIVQTGTTCGPMAALIAADAALGRGLVRPADLQVTLDAMRRVPHTALLRPFLELADGRSQSAGETRLRHAVHLLNYRATPQAQITDGARTAYVDLLLDDYPVVLEFDGLVKYGGGGLRPGREELVEEKRREDWMRDLGYQVVRVVWADLDDRPGLGQAIDRAIRRATGRRGT